MNTNTGGRPARSGNYTTGRQYETRLLYEAIGRALEKRRRECDMTRAELARRSGESERTVRTAEGGFGLPVRSLFALADALGCTVDDLRGA